MDTSSSDLFVKILDLYYIREEVHQTRTAAIALSRGVLALPPRDRETIDGLPEISA